MPLGEAETVHWLHSPVQTVAGFNWSLRSTPEYPTMHRAGPGAVHCWILRRTPERPIEPRPRPSVTVSDIRRIQDMFAANNYFTLKC